MSDPDDPQAYACPAQYAFGSELLVAPYAEPRAADTQLSRQVVWLPPGDWYDFFSGQHYGALFAATVSESPSGSATA